VPDAPPSTTARAGGESGRLSRAPTQAPPPVAIPYKTAPKRVISTEKDDVFETRAEAHFVERLKEVLEHEAPIHCDLLATKVMSAWSWQRLRQRARERFDLLLQRAETKGLVQLRGPFAWRPGQRVEHYRLADEEGAIRSIDYVPPEEAAVAAAWLLDQNLSLESGELVRETARLLGYERVRGQVEAAVRVALDILVRSGRARIAGSRVEKP
jgi:hypothetical protein